MGELTQGISQLDVCCLQRILRYITLKLGSICWMGSCLVEVWIRLQQIMIRLMDLSRHESSSLVLDGIDVKGVLWGGRDSECSKLCVQ